MTIWEEQTAGIKATIVAIVMRAALLVLAELDASELHPPSFRLRHTQAEECELIGHRITLTPHQRFLQNTTSQTMSSDDTAPRHKSSTSS